MKKGIIIQARMSSQRLAGKSLRKLYDESMVYYVVERMRRVRSVDTVILATSNDSTDDELAEYAQENNIPLYRGELDDVQKRFYGAAFDNGLDVIIRVTGDNPLISPELVECLCCSWDASPCDYIGFNMCTLGTGSELFTFESFKTVLNHSETDYEKEHVTPYYYQGKGNFALRSLDAPPELYDPDLRLTVDTEDDFFLMQKVYKRYAINNYVELKDVIKGVSDAKKSG